MCLVFAIGRLPISANLIRSMATPSQSAHVIGVCLQLHVAQISRFEFLFFYRGDGTRLLAGESRI